MTEKIYNDFTEKLLPKIQEGLIITKDYFTDLFSRYVKYLIISDIISLILCLVIFVLVCYLSYLFYKKINQEDYDSWGNEGRDFFTTLVYGCVLLVSFCGVITYTSNLVKDIFIPEVRIMEKINMINR